MFRELATRLLSVHRILVLTLSLSAAAGWVSFAISSRSATKFEDQLRHELASLQDAQAKLISERSKMRASLSDMAQMRADLAAARTEIAQLSQPIVQAKPDLPSARPEVQKTPRAGNGNTVTQTGSIATTPSKPRHGKAASGEKPLPQGNNGQVAIIRIATPIGQKVAERSQRDAASPTKPELDTASLRRLTKSAEAQTQ